MAKFYIKVIYHKPCPKDAAYEVEATNQGMAAYKAFKLLKAEYLKGKRISDVKIVFSVQPLTMTSEI